MIQKCSDLKSDKILLPSYKKKSTKDKIQVLGKGVVIYDRGFCCRHR